MSITEIKSEAASLPPEELHHLAAWFYPLWRRKEPAYLQKLDAAYDSIDAGDCFSLDEFKRLSGELDKSGL